MKLETHERLLILDDEQLKTLAPLATHQHYKGGLYKLVTDKLELIDGTLGCLVMHDYPHRLSYRARTVKDFQGMTLPTLDSAIVRLGIVSGEHEVRRFRKLKRQAPYAEKGETWEDHGTCKHPKTMNVTSAFGQRVQCTTCGEILELEKRK